MQITVSGKQVDVGDALRTHIEKRLNEGVSKYIDRMTHITVVVSRESHLFRVDINGNTGTSTGTIIKGKGDSEDVYAAFDVAATHIEKQLRRYKRRITNHHKNRSQQDITAYQATKYVIAPEQGDDLHEEAAPVIVAEKATNIETLTVSEAVMKMDLADLPALLFFNSASGRVNVVYRRVDGNISWVDPETKAA
jgi:ribosomal subunit interface protein